MNPGLLIDFSDLFIAPGCDSNWRKITQKSQTFHLNNRKWILGSEHSAVKLSCQHINELKIYVCKCRQVGECY